MDAKWRISIKQLKNNTVLIHTVIGMIAGYFLLHPITMVIYWFEINHTDVTLNNVLEGLITGFAHAFHLHMMPMSVAFAIIGGLTGMGSGLYFRKIRNQHRKIQAQQSQLTESIQSIIRNGENEKVEFKSSLRYDFKKGQPNKVLEDLVVKSIAGFMNATGGTLIIGVDESGLRGLADDYVSLGRQNRQGFEQRLMQIVAAKLGGDICPLVHVDFHGIIDYEVCSVYIEKANRPVYIREGENPVFYLRTGKIAKPLNTMETVEYLKARDQL